MIIKIIVFIFIISIRLFDTTNIIEVYHLIDNALWGNVDGSAVQGNFMCSNQLQCEFYSSDSKTNFMETLQKKYTQYSRKYNNNTIDNVVTVSLYNIHTYGLLSPYPHRPDYCKLPSDISIVESEESFSRFKRLFSDSFPNYDGNSTTHPSSSIQRYYFDLQNTTLLPNTPFSKLIKGAVFVASTCHRNKRDDLVIEIGKYIRLDSLGKCRHGSNMKRMNSSSEQLPVKLSHSSNTLENIISKQNGISNYLFYLAFENTLEPGYVTEKIFDAFVAGTVPVYFGHSDCRQHIPHPKAAIFVDDYRDVATLVEYLNYLSINESAYEEHRIWRKTFNSSFSSSSLYSWPCNICNFAWKHRTTKHGCNM